MSRLGDLMRPGDPEDHAAERISRRRFGLWAMAALIVLLPAWWFWGADVAIVALRPVADIVLKLFGLSGGVSSAAPEGWFIGTGLKTAAGTDFILPVSRTLLRRFVLGAPLFAALMIAPPRVSRPGVAVAVGIGVLTILFVLSLTAFVWGELAPILNHALLADGLQRAALSSPPLPAIGAQVAMIGRYVAISIAPLLTTVIMWACLNPGGRHVLLGDIGAPVATGD